MDDSDLARAIQAGHEDQVRVFASRFQGRIEAIVRRRGVPSRDRDDVVQDILADAVRQLHQGRFRGESVLGTWVYRIALGKIADYWRKHRPLGLVGLDEVEEGHEALVATGNQDAILAVRQALDRLSAEDRLLLQLHEQYGYTLDEMAPLFRLKKSAVAERVARARDRFRSQILGCGKIIGPKRLTD